jgi:hypothetical protein
MLHISPGVIRSHEANAGQLAIRAQRPIGYFGGESLDATLGSHPRRRKASVSQATPLRSPMTSHQAPTPNGGHSFSSNRSPFSILASPAPVQDFRSTGVPALPQPLPEARDDSSVCYFSMKVLNRPTALSVWILTWGTRSVQGKTPSLLLNLWMCVPAPRSRRLEY